MESGSLKACAMKWLRRRGSDGSGRKPGWKVLSDYVALFIGGAESQGRRLMQVASMSQFQGHVLRTNTCALTSGSSGSQTLRYATSLLTTNPKR